MIKQVHVIFGIDDDVAPKSNTYIIVFDNLDAIIVDPSLSNSIVTKYLKRNKLKPIGVFLTHGHFDHFLGLPFILKKYNIPVYIGRNDVICLGNKEYNLSSFNKDPHDQIEVVCTVKDLVEGTISVNDHEVQIIETPFHTLGSVCYYFPEDQVIFTGDTLMKNTIGRFDLKHSAPRQVINSLNKLTKMVPDNVTIYPGHDELTTMEDEKKNNVYVKRFTKGE